MIGYLRGEIFENSEGKLIVLASGGVGYSVSVPQSASYLSFVPGKAVELHIHTHVREDALDLFGFASRLEKEIFLTLLTVNGIGPKVAMGILSRVEPQELIRAVVEADKDSLTQIPGIGKKTAERVVLELGDKIRKRLETGELAAPKASSERRASASLPTAYRDAKDALVGLGYREADVADILKRLLEESDTAPAHAEQLVKSALRELN